MTGLVTGYSHHLRIIRLTSLYLTRQRERWARPNAHLFVRPDWRRFVAQDQDDHPFAFYEKKYRNDQPRVPGGSREGGQWTADGSPPTDKPPINDRRVISDATPDNDWEPGAQYAQADGVGSSSDTRPVYDTADAALLPPKGVDAKASQQRLTYRLDHDAQYLGGVTVANEDRTVAGKIITEINGTPVHVSFEGQIDTANGSTRANFEVRVPLPPGGSTTISWKEFGPIQGPGNVSIVVTNRGSLCTGVVIGAHKISNR